MPEGYVGGIMLTPMDCQAARGRLQWTRERLAAEAGVAASAVLAFELEQAVPQPGLVAALTGALEAAEMTLSSVSGTDRWTNPD
jgi:transcriptional regulator with XRE-family HTH domain